MKVTSATRRSMRRHLLVAVVVVFVAQVEVLPERLRDGLDGVGRSLDDQDAGEAIEILEENFGDRVFASRITKTVRFAEAPVKGMSVLKYDPDGKAAFAYRRLAEEVLENGSR